MDSGFTSAFGIKCSDSGFTDLCGNLTFEEPIFCFIPTCFASVFRYLLAPGEDEGGERRRATDPVWSLEVFDLSRSVVSPAQPVLYYLPDGP